MDAIGREQQMLVINESGMYSLIFGSKLDSAKRFKRWVTSEVLPSIRKNGTYLIDNTKQDSYTIADPVERAKRWIEEQEEKKLLQNKISELEPKAKLCDDILDAKLLVNFRDAAKEIGISQSQFTGWLKDNGYKGSRTYVTGRGLAAFKTLLDENGYNRYTMKKHGGRNKR